MPQCRLLGSEISEESCNKAMKRAKAAWRAIEAGALRKVKEMHLDRLCACVRCPVCTVELPAVKVVKGKIREELIRCLDAVESWGEDEVQEREVEVKAGAVKRQQRYRERLKEREKGGKK